MTQPMPPDRAETSAPGHVTQSGPGPGLITQLIRQRRRLGITQQDLAIRLNVSQSTVGSWELGARNPQVASLLLWAAEVGLQVALVPLPCERCQASPAVADHCCSSHGKLLCHGCYRRTHFVERCVKGCPLCAAEGLPVVQR